MKLKHKLSKSEINFMNENEVCSSCNHLDLFHDPEIGMCLIEDCKEPKCGRDQDPDKLYTELKDMSDGYLPRIQPFCSQHGHVTWDDPNFCISCRKKI